MPHVQIYVEHNLSSVWTATASSFTVSYSLRLGSDIRYRVLHYFLTIAKMYAVRYEHLLSLIYYLFNLIRQARKYIYVIRFILAIPNVLYKICLFYHNVYKQKW